MPAVAAFDEVVAPSEAASLRARLSDLRPDLGLSGTILPGWDQADG